MHHEDPSPELAAELTSWWQQAFRVLLEDFPGARSMSGQYAALAQDPEQERCCHE